MKHIYSLLSTTLFLCAFIACQKEEKFADSKKGDFEMFASVEQQGEPDTKTSISGTTVSWTAGDAVRVYNSQGTAYTDLVTETGDGHFEGGSLSGTPSVVIYPSTFGTGYNEGKISFTLPETQVYAENSFGPNTNVAVASFAAKTTFYNVCGVLKLKLKGDFIVSKIELTSEDKLWGNFKATVSTTPAMENDGAATEAEKTVTLTCEDGVQLNRTTETVFNIVVPTGALSDGFSAKVYEKDNTNTYNYSLVETSHDNTIKRSNILAMPEKTMLPAGIFRTEYLESTGAQYIWTGLSTSDYSDATISGTITTVTEESGKAYLFKGQSGRITDALFKNGEETVAHFVPCIDMNKPGDAGTGVNLFDKTTMVQHSYVETDGTVAIKTNTGNYNGYSIVMPCLPDRRYEFSRSESSNRYRAACFSSYPTEGSIGTVVSSDTEIESCTNSKFTTTSDAAYLQIWFMHEEKGSYETVEEFLESQKNQINIKLIPEGLGLMVDLSGRYDNLFNPYNTVAGYIETDGKVFLKGSPADNQSLSIIVPCKPSTTYTFSRETSGIRFRTGFTSTYPQRTAAGFQGTVASPAPHVAAEVTNFTFTTAADASYIFIWILAAVDYTGTYSSFEEALEDQKFTIQVEEGASATSYSRCPFMYNDGSDTFIYE